MSYRYSKTELACKVYVGNLGTSASRQEIEDHFGRHGTLKNVWVARNPPGFAFVEYEDPRDAEDAVRSLDGKMICGHHAQVEMSSGEKRNRGTRGGGGRPQRTASYDDKCYSCNERGHFARDCRNGRVGGGGGGGRDGGRYGGRSGGSSSRSYSKRSRSRSRDRSYSPRRTNDRSRSRSRSYSPRRRRSRSSSDRD